MLLLVRTDDKMLFRPNTCSILTYLHFTLFFFLIAPRKAAVKTEKPDKKEGEKKTSAERKTLAQEGKDLKW